MSLNSPVSGLEIPSSDSENEAQSGESSTIQHSTPQSLISGGASSSPSNSSGSELPYADSEDESSITIVEEHFQQKVLSTLKE